MSRDDDAFLLDILAEARRIGRFVDGITAQQFEADELRRYAVMHAIALLGEAARRVSAERRATLPELPWTGMTGMRSVLIHDYGNVLEAEVWRTATEDVPPLISKLESILGTENDG